MPEGTRLSRLLASGQPNAVKNLLEVQTARVASYDGPVGKLAAGLGQVMQDRIDAVPGIGVNGRVRRRQRSESSGKAIMARGAPESTAWFENNMVIPIFAKPKEKLSDLPEEDVHYLERKKILDSYLSHFERGRDQFFTPLKEGIVQILFDQELPAKPNVDEIVIDPTESSASEMSDEQVTQQVTTSKDSAAVREKKSDGKDTLPI